jgi:hypothetical protein
MTRKDYVAIAKEINLHLSASEDGIQGARTRAVVRVLAAGIADVMAADNPSFDRARFLKACGVQS